MDCYDILWYDNQTKKPHRSTLFTEIFQTVVHNPSSFEIPTAFKTLFIICRFVHLICNIGFSNKNKEKEIKKQFSRKHFLISDFYHSLQRTISKGIS